VKSLNGLNWGPDPGGGNLGDGCEEIGETASWRSRDRLVVLTGRGFLLMGGEPSVGEKGWCWFGPGGGVRRPPGGPGRKEGGGLPTGFEGGPLKGEFERFRAGSRSGGGGAEASWVE
jgi:hypothetical protein